MSGMKTLTDEELNIAVKYVFTMVCYRGIADKETQIQTEEHILAETWAQALEYWKLDLQCLNTEVISMKKQVPIIAVCQEDKRL